MHFCAFIKNILTLHFALTSVTGEKMKKLGRAYMKKTEIHGNFEIWVENYLSAYSVLITFIL